MHPTSQPLRTLQEFYELMAQTKRDRCEIVERYLESSSVKQESTDLIQLALQQLSRIHTTSQGSQLDFQKGKQVTVDLHYEITELEKDILFLTQGEHSFDAYLRRLHSGLSEQVERCLRTLKPIAFRNFISDRDGTINNYCGRYLSSIQSVYNAVFISRFAKKCVKNTIILTSAPLENGGLVDVSTIPSGTIIQAGSKGREYRDIKNRRGTFPIDHQQQKKLDQLNQRIAALIKEPHHQKFGLLGSAFQQKFGQTTIARQDITKSVPDDESVQFLETLKKLVMELDPEKKFFRIEDTGLDVEIILTVPDTERSQGLVDFSKGNGVAFLNQQLHLELDKGPNLVCGDTNSDIPMLEECLKSCKDTWSIFVTKDSKLIERIQKLTSQAMIIDNPDTLVYILNKLAIG